MSEEENKHFSPGAFASEPQGRRSFVLFHATYNLEQEMQVALHTTDQSLDRISTDPGETQTIPHGIGCVGEILRT